MSSTPKRSVNPFAFGKPITLDTLGELFAHHAAISSGHRMSITPPEPEPNENPGGPSDDPPNLPTYTPPATQADLDRIVGERVARERAKYADYQELKTKAEAHDKALEDAQSEQEKAVAAARREGEAEARKQSDQRIINAEARALAATAKFRNPTTAVRLLDLTGVGVNDAGDPDVDAIKAKLDELATAEPYLIDTGTAPAPRPDSSQGGGGGGGGATKPTSIAEARALARAEREKRNPTKTA